MTNQKLNDAIEITKLVGLLIVVACIPLAMSIALRINPNLGYGNRVPHTR